MDWMIRRKIARLVAIIIFISLFAMMPFESAAAGENGPPLGDRQPVGSLRSDRVYWSGPDDDLDGVPNDIEDAGPNNGDADYSGILDSAESHVATFPDIYDEYVTIVVPFTASLSDVEAIDSPSYSDEPEGAFDNGFFDFTIYGASWGGETVVEIYLPLNLFLELFYAYGLEAGDASDHWIDFLYDGVVGAEFDHGWQTVITLHLVDGERGDCDLIADGVIRVVGGPASQLLTGDFDSGSVGAGGGGCFVNTIGED